MPDVLDPQATCILFFDLLNGHVKKDDPATRERYRPVIANNVALLQKARETGVMVAYAAANHRADKRTTAKTIRDTDNKLTPIAQGYDERLVHANTWENQVIDEIAPTENDFLIPKYRWSAFHQTYFDLALRTQKITTLIITGGSTDVGLASTAYAARDMDYNLVFPEDACSSHQMDNHHYFMKKIFPRMGRVRSTAQVVEMLK